MPLLLLLPPVRPMLGMRLVSDVWLLVAAFALLVLKSGPLPLLLKPAMLRECCCWWLPPPLRLLLVVALLLVGRVNMAAGHGSRCRVCCGCCEAGGNMPPPLLGCCMAAAAAVPKAAHNSRSSEVLTVAGREPTSTITNASVVEPTQQARGVYRQTALSNPFCAGEVGSRVSAVQLSDWLSHSVLLPAHHAAGCSLILRADAADAALSTLLICLFLGLGCGYSPWAGYVGSKRGCMIDGVTPGGTPERAVLQSGLAVDDESRNRRLFLGVLESRKEYC